jgi:hypothetical protein
MKNFTFSLLRKLLIISLFLLLYSPVTIAQHIVLGNEKLQIEAGINFGPTFFLGDLGGKVGKGTTFIKDLNFQLTKLMKGAFISVYPSNWWGVRVAGQYTYIEGIDKIISTYGVDELWRKQRNIDFKSNMWELYAAVEFFPVEFIKRNDGEYNPRFRPYFFGGVGAFHFNPKGSLTDENGNVTWHELKPLSTEGQGFAEYPNKKPYNLTQMNVPFGMGFKYLVTEKVNIGLELLYRKTFTDYMDDVSTTYIDPNYFDVYLSATDALIAKQISDKTFGIVTPGVSRYDPGVQRGNPNNKDAYFSFVFKVGVNFGGGAYRNAYDKSSAGRVKCPARF